MKMQIEMLHVEHLTPNPNQPRQIFDAEELERLANSIEQHGLLQPIVSRVSRTQEGKFEIIAGERRWRAVRALGWDLIPTRIMDVKDEYSATLALIENIQRADLNLLEVAQSYQNLLTQHQWTYEQLAEHVSSTRQQVGHVVSVLRLPEPVKRYLASGSIGLGHAKLLVSLPDSDDIEALATRIVREGLTVRNCQDIISQGSIRVEVIESEGSASSKNETTGKKRQKRNLSPDWIEWQETIEEHLDTKVKVDGSGKTKKLVIFFSDADDLARLNGLFALGKAAQQDTIS